MTEEDIIAFAAQRLAKFKVPRTVVFSELPKTSTGKIQKFVLRETGEKLVSIPRGGAVLGAPPAGKTGGSVDGASQPLELVLDSEFLFFQGGDPHFIPIGIGHFGSR